MQTTSSSTRMGIYIAGVSPRRLDFGLILVVFAVLVNLGVGWYLIRTGKRTKSPTLVASGHHLISDFYTSAAIMVGLGLVLLTGITWLDPAVAIAVALHLGWIGFKIVKGSTAALMDAGGRQSHVAKAPSEHDHQAMMSLHPHDVFRFTR